MRGQNDQTLITRARMSGIPGHIHQVHGVTKKEKKNLTCLELADGCKHIAITAKEVIIKEQKLNQRQGKSGSSPGVRSLMLQTPVMFDHLLNVGLEVKTKSNAMYDFIYMKCL